jgi:hypothetical protein
MYRIGIPGYLAHPFFFTHQTFPILEHRAVFMTFWQGLAIAILAASIGEATPNVGSDDAELWAKQAQNFLICLEMLLFSIAHFYCFPTEEWEEGYRPVASDAKFGDQLALNDFFQDLKLLARQGKQKNKSKKKSSLDKENGGSDGDTKKAGDGSDNDDTTAREAADESFDEENLNLSQVESQIEGNLASPDPNIRAASLRLLQAMAFETPMAQRDTSSMSAISSPRAGHGEGSRADATSRVLDSSQPAEDLPANSSRSPRTETDELSDVDEDYEEQAADEESNTVTLRYDDEPGEETGLLRSSDRNGSDETSGGNVMGGGASSDDDSVLRPSLFTTLAKFS